MHLKVLECRISTYSDYKNERHWLEIFRAKIDSDQDIEGELGKGGEQAKHAFTLHEANLLLYAIAHGKAISTNSIFNYINLNENENENEWFMKYFLSACDTYFESDEYQRDACRIITFMKEKNILKDFLKKYLNNKTVEKLSRKDEETNKYLCEDKVIFSAILEKNKIDQRKSYFKITCLISIILTLFVLSQSAIWISFSKEIFTKPLVILSLCATLSLLLLGIAGSIWMSYAENNIPVEKMQQKLNAEQNSQDTASSKEQKVEEQTPTTVLKIYIRPEPSYANTSFGDDMAIGCCLGMVFGSALS